jgi:hypothetical protein
LSKRIRSFKRIKTNHPPPAVYFLFFFVMSDSDSESSQRNGNDQAKHTDTEADQTSFFFNPLGWSNLHVRSHFPPERVLEPIALIGQPGEPTPGTLSYGLLGTPTFTGDQKNRRWRFPYAGKSGRLRCLDETVVVINHRLGLQAVPRSTLEWWKLDPAVDNTASSQSYG